MSVASSKGTAVRGWSSVVLRGSGVLARLALQVVVARQGGAASLGTFAGLLSAGQVSGTVTAGGLGQISIRALPQVAGPRRQAEALQLLRSSAARAMGWLLAGSGFAAVAVFAWDGSVARTILAAAACGAAFAVIRIASDLLRASGQAPWAMITEFIVPGFTGILGVAVFVLLLDPRAHSAFFGAWTALACLGTAAFVGVLVVRCTPYSYWERGSGQGTQVVANRSGELPLAISASLTAGGSVFLPALLAVAFGAEASASPVAALRILAIPTVVMSGLAATFGRAFSVAYASSDKRTLRSLLRRSQLWAVGAYVPVMLGVVLAPDIVFSMFGDEIEPSASVMFVIALAQMANAVTGLAPLQNYMCGFERSEMYAVTLSTAITLGGMMAGWWSDSVLIAIAFFAVGQVVRNGISYVVSIRSTARLGMT